MDIYCFGDSITRGENDHVHGGWADRLKRLCMERFAERAGEEICVFNLGIGGETTASLRKRFLPELDARLDPDSRGLVLLAYGANDAAEVGGRSLVVVDQYTEHLAACIDAAAGRKNRVLLLNVTPIADSIDGVANARGRVRRNASIGDYNRALERLARERSAGLVDVHSAFMSRGHDSLFVADGVHPNSAGHALIFELVCKELSRISVLG